MNAVLDWFRRLVARPNPPAPAPAPPAFGGGGASGTWWAEIPRRTRGLRNRNPGNIRGGQTPWKGETGRDKDGFCTFESDHYGLRAAAKLLVTYRTKHGLDCIEELIGRWAPSSENNTRAYIDAVARELGVPPMMPITVHDPVVLVPLLAAIVRHENGLQPYPLPMIRFAVDDALEVTA